VLALLATGTARAALWGLLGLAGLVGGYYLTAISRHVPESPASIRFWMLAAVIIGPLLGVAASWVRRGSLVTAALGAGAAAGLLGGESVYGLTAVAGSTSSLYWTSGPRRADLTGPANPGRRPGRVAGGAAAVTGSSRAAR
jgi:hypothetical protein